MISFETNSELENNSSEDTILENILEDKRNFYVYLLVATHDKLENSVTYVGATVDLDRRLKQHNGIISGGAKFTKKYKNWKRVCSIHNFPSWNASLQFEWKLKNLSRKIKNKNSLEKRLIALEQLLNSEKSTFNSLEFRFWSQPPIVKIEMCDAIPFFEKSVQLMKFCNTPNHI